MGTEIRHKGPIPGQIVLFNSGALGQGTIPAVICSVQKPADTCNLAYWGNPGGSITTVPHDPSGASATSWRWSEDIQSSRAIRHRGPRQGQIVCYNSTGFPTPTFIVSVNADGTANLSTSAPSYLPSIRYDANNAVGTWNYFDNPPGHESRNQGPQIGQFIWVNTGTEVDVGYIYPILVNGGYQSSHPADGTVHIAYWTNAGSPHVTDNVPYDYTGVNSPSWWYNEDV